METLEEREPEAKVFCGQAEEEFFGSLEWKSLSRWDELEFDQTMRTGTTFGFITGVHAGFVHPSLPSPPTNEY